MHLAPSTATTATTTLALPTLKRALGPPAFLAESVAISARKFEQMGVWRSFARIVAILVCLRLGRTVPATFFANIR